MKRDLITFKNIRSSFLSCEKDMETILRRLFIESQPYSETLKRLLVINTKDCLDNLTNEVYKQAADLSLAELIKEGYIVLQPKIRVPEHEEVKAYILISFDDFTPTNTNAPYYRDCMIHFDILCHTDYWDIGNYRCRPLKIAGYIDGILNECHLSGIGTLNFMGCNELILNEDLSGYTLTYHAVHGNDDRIEGDED